ncbi:DNA-binding protein [Candidatus Bathyarchaeota archaeon]|nr:DNA-binding protein [Candidatus Bathyarchaeota archaeon]MBS7630555.1 DNA-binding protein [Candidatus Bathyarchaeota archaeon]
MILDTNFLFIPSKFGIDIFEELERLFEGRVKCIVPTTVIEELRVLRSKAKPSMVKKIDFALSLTEKCELKQVEEFKKRTVDDSIIRLAKKLECPVATNDSELKHVLINEKIPVIYLRQKDHLEITRADMV